MTLRVTCAVLSGPDIFEGDVSKRPEDALAHLDRLGVRTKNIFILFRLQGMRQGEIAAMYGISAAEVERHLQAAMVELAKFFQSR